MSFFSSPVVVLVLCRDASRHSPLARFVLAPSDLARAA
jgi:hypothetical protein